MSRFDMFNEYYSRTLAPTITTSLLGVAQYKIGDDGKYEGYVSPDLEEEARENGFGIYSNWRDGVHILKKFV